MGKNADTFTILAYTSIKNIKIFNIYDKLINYNSDDTKIEMIKLALNTLTCKDEKLLYLNIGETAKIAKITNSN